MDSKDFNKFLQFSKVTEDEDGNVLVYGIATQEKPDLDDEICMYAAAKPVYQEWAEAAAERTTNAGQEISYGPIRLQHGIEIGGKATKIEYDDDARQIWLGSLPLNEDIRDDLKAGYYTGYSQGGSYAWRRCADCGTSMPLQQGRNNCPKCKKNVQVEYGLKRLSEVSYVDSPCSGVGFDYVKANGSREFVKFAKRSERMDLTKEQIADIAEQMRKAAKTKRVAGEDLTHDQFAYVGDPEKTETWNLAIKFSDAAKTKRHIRKALPLVSLIKGIPEEEKAKVKEKIIAAAKEHGIEVSEDGQSKAHQAFVETVSKAAEAKSLEKGLWEVGRLAEQLQGMAYIYENAIYERDMEGDGSEVPEELKDILDNMVEVFIAMAEEEARELAARTNKADTTTKGDVMSDTNEEVLKAAKKSFAQHFAKSAAHHEKLAAHHEEMCDACKADVGSGADEGKVSPAPIYKALEKHHAKMAKAHSKFAEHLSKMAESHDKEEAEKALKAEREAEPIEEKVEKKAPVAEDQSLDADVEKAAAAYRNSDEYKNSINAIAKAKLDAELAKLRSETVIPDGVTLAGMGLKAVPRTEEAKDFKFADAPASSDLAGL